VWDETNSKMTQDRFGSYSDLGPRPSLVRFTLDSGNRQTARACPYRIVSLGRVTSNLVCYQQAQRCIVSNALLANEGHCIDLGTCWTRAAIGRPSRGMS
jgi:hypothetical protein